MTVESIMTQDVVAIGMDDPLYQIREQFEQRGFHHLLVVDEEELIGVISDRDVLLALSPFLTTMAEKRRDEQTLFKRAHQIMTRNPITVSVETGIEEAACLLLKHNIGCLPVVATQLVTSAGNESHLRLISSGHRVEGIVTWRDILQHYLRT